MMRRSNPYRFPGQSIGRPRERFYAADFGDAVLDANALRRQAKDAGERIGDPEQVIRVGWTDRDGWPHDAVVEVVATPHPLYGVRWWLRCPRCGTQRGKLYVPPNGPACRCCLELGYRRQKRDQV